MSEVGVTEYIYIGPQDIITHCVTRDSRRARGEYMSLMCCQYYCPGKVNHSCPFSGEDLKDEVKNLFAAINWG